MRKKLLVAAMVAMVGLGSIYGYRTISTQPETSDIVAANLEALADNEGSGSRFKCYSAVHYEENSTVVICSTCEEVNHRTDDFFCFHDWCYRD